MAVNISSTSLQVSWDPVPAIDRNGIITQYEVEYNQTTFSEVSMYNTTTVNSTTLNVSLCPLEEYVEYTIRVRAYTSVGAGPYSDLVNVTTNEDSKNYCSKSITVIQYGLHTLANFLRSSYFTSEQCKCCQYLFNCDSSVLEYSPCH